MVVHALHCRLHKLYQNVAQVCPQKSVPSQTSDHSMRLFPQYIKDSVLQVELQPSPSLVFPSSHSSPGSTVPSPQTGVMTCRHIVVIIVHEGEQIRFQLSYHSPMQSCPQKSVPSHSSQESIVPLPQRSMTGGVQLIESTQYGGGVLLIRSAVHCISVIVL